MTGQGKRVFWREYFTPLPPEKGLNLKPTMLDTIKAKYRTAGGGNPILTTRFR